MIAAGIPIINGYCQVQFNYLFPQTGLAINVSQLSTFSGSSLTVRSSLIKGIIAPRRLVLESK